MFSHSVSSSGGGITDVVQDLTPQLGGDLDCVNNSLTTANNITLKSVSMIAGVADVIPTALNHSLYNLIQTNGNVYKDLTLGHDVLNPLLGFPNGQQILYVNNLPLLNNVLVSKTRDAAAAVITIGSSRQALFGNTTSFTDRLIYDPVALRSTKSGTSWMRIQVRPHVDLCMWNFRCHYDIDFAAPNPNNRLQIKVIQYRGGLLLRTYTLLDMISGSVENIGSCERMINSFGFSEDVVLGDQFSLHIQCGITSPTQIQVCRLVQWSVYVTPRI